MGTEWFSKTNTATVVAAFVVISGVVLTAIESPVSELMIGAGVGYLFGKLVESKINPQTPPG